ncbi:hypothetical protein WDL1P2_00438 (plasmid) [Variovorax sp. WDL1]|uniref:DUF4124 domain-containing protein n=1 Tax=Variovorax sp. WDL1 TaxID=207745 RepID=UPI000A06AFBA|nr:hypothetical protein CHC06_06402 [Variovorax sp. B2]PNG49550.1 hypothetical protein CHC07_06459 [Variovorax sp. B4]VTV18798.1 hypothetical protein WDL1P2_00438 [Variovorax sp. WDL1]
MRSFIFFAVLVAASSASAQVHRCIEASGRVAYSDQPCGTTAKSSEQVLGSDATAPRYDPYARERNMTSIYRARANLEGSVDTVTRQSQGEGDAAIMSAPEPRQRSAERQGADPNPESCDTYSTRKGCMGGARANNPNWSARRGYYGAGGSADRAYEEEQARARQAAARAPAPAVATNCNAGGCWDGAGNRYNRTGAGDKFWRSDGKLCRARGNTITCN